MKIIILRDKKGFSKSIEVPAFPPVYDVAEMPDIFAFKGFLEDIRQPTIRRITFYPHGEPKENNGVWTLIYTEH